MGRKPRTDTWINNLFDGHELGFPDGTVWKIGEKISEKTLELSWNPPPGLAEGQAVYYCHQVKGPRVGEEAVIKIRMQVPFDYRASRNPNVLAREASYPSSLTYEEIETLEYLNSHNCSVVPKLLYKKAFYQGSGNFPVPYGYIVMLVMEKCPGTTLENFTYRFKPEEQEKIKKAFERGYMELQRLGIQSLDPSPTNIIYDEKEDKCWFIDHEMSCFEEPSGTEFFWRSTFQEWGLEPYDSDLSFKCREEDLKRFKLENPTSEDSSTEGD